MNRDLVHNSSKNGVPKVMEAGEGEKNQQALVCLACGAAPPAEGCFGSGNVYSEVLLP